MGCNAIRVVFYKKGSRDIETETQGERCDNRNWSGMSASQGMPKIPATSEAKRKALDRSLLEPSERVTDSWILECWPSEL